MSLFVNSRPSTSSGRRPATSAGLTSAIGPDVDVGTTGGIVSREIGHDDFLRITNHDRVLRESEAMLASEQGNMQKLDELVKQGLVASSVRGLQGYSLLHHAASNGHALVISELVRLGVDSNVRNDSLETPLHLAVYHGHILAVDQLLDFGAEVNAQNADLETPLFYATRRNMPAIVRLLVQRGSDVNIVDAVGDKAADHATNSSILRHLEVNPAINESNDRLTHDLLLRVMSFLPANDLLRASCVSCKWHRVSEQEVLWKALGVRKWELALQSSLGFAPTTTSAMFRPKRTSSKSKLIKPT